MTQIVQAAAHDGELELGERVTVLDLRTAVVFDYRVVPAGTPDPPAGELPADSSLGAALLGRRVGDVLELETHAGPVSLEVVEIDG